MKYFKYYKIIIITMEKGERGLPERVESAISFLSGIIAYNTAMTFLQGQYIVSFISLLALIVAFIIKRFVDWTAQ